MKYAVVEVFNTFMRAAIKRGAESLTN